MQYVLILLPSGIRRCLRAQSSMLKRLTWSAKMHLIAVIGLEFFFQMMSNLNQVTLEHHWARGTRTRTRDNCVRSSLSFSEKKTIYFAYWQLSRPKKEFFQEELELEMLPDEIVKYV
jgi:hypothetical protein